MSEESDGCGEGTKAGVTGSAPNPMDNPEFVKAIQGLIGNAMEEAVRKSAPRGRNDEVEVRLDKNAVQVFDDVTGERSELEQSEERSCLPPSSCTRGSVEVFST